MKSICHKSHRYNFALLISLGTVSTFFAQQSWAAEPVSPVGEETKHIHIPFVHIDIKKHANGTKDVDVKAPFTKVHNPAGDNNAQVKAPFYKVDRQPAGTVSTTRTTAAH